MEVISGASSAFYGPNAFNGVISMYTKTHLNFKDLVRVSKEGSECLMNMLFDTQSISNDKGEDKFAFKVNFSYLSADDWVADNANSVEGKTWIYLIRVAMML